MMKRPRSFISTLLIFVCLATVSLGLTTYSRPAQASSLPRLMDPRAGEPDEPSSPMQLPAEGITPLEARRAYQLQNQDRTRYTERQRLGLWSHFLSWWRVVAFTDGRR
jgi:hypothetical protein